MDSRSAIRDYLNPSDRTSGSSSGYTSPLRKPNELDDAELDLKENHWIGNMSNISQDRPEKRTEQHFAQIVTISKTTHRNEWMGPDISSVRPSYLETPIGREHQTEVEQLHLQIRRLKTELQRRDVSSRSKSKTKTQQNDESILEPAAPTTIYMREINIKNIEITKLRESYSILKSENETLTLIVREKESEVQLLQSRLDELNKERKQFENYEVAMSESKSVFKDYEERQQIMKRDIRTKDGLIDELRLKYQQLTDRSKLSEERMCSLQKQLTETSAEKTLLNDNLNESLRECDEWKRNYVDASRQLSILPELQIKLKNSLSTSKDLEERIADLLASNEKLKMQINGQQLKDKKLQELEILYQIVLKENREKSELIESLTERLGDIEHRLGAASELQDRIGSLERSMEEKSRDYKALERKHEQKSILTANYERQIKRLNEDLEKYRQRNEKIDQIYKQNKRLTSLLMDKINLIEQQQVQLNSQESKLASLVNEKIKVTALYEQCMETVEELTRSIDDAKRQADVDAETKLQLHARCDKLVTDITTLTTSINKEKDLTKSLTAEREALRKETDSLTDRLYEEESRFELFKSESESKINHDRQKIESLTLDLKDLKKRIQSASKKDKQSNELISTLQAQKCEHETRISQLQQHLQQSQQETSKLSRWKHQYLHYLESFRGLASNMQTYCQTHELH